MGSEVHQLGIDFVTMLLAKLIPQTRSGERVFEVAPPRIAGATLTGTPIAREGKWMRTLVYTDSIKKTVPYSVEVWQNPPSRRVVATELEVWRKSPIPDTEICLGATRFDKDGPDMCEWVGTLCDLATGEAHPMRDEIRQMYYELSGDLY
jgi:hypothetical protein